MGLEGFPEIITVAKLEHERSNFGGIWHSDTTYLEQPPMGTLLVAREVPPVGGDTLFANQYLAYETLSDRACGRCWMGCARSAVRPRPMSPARVRIASRAMVLATARAELSAEHPVVRTHPETGRKALYVNVAHTARFADVTEEESAGLLNFLFRHQIRPEFTCRFHWETGSVAFWDNRCAQHNPINDYHGYRRVMHRITLAGDTPR